MFLFKQNLVYLRVSLFLTLLIYYYAIPFKSSDLSEKTQKKCSLTCLMSQYNKPRMSQFKPRVLRNVYLPKQIHSDLNFLESNVFEGKRRKSEKSSCK